MAETRKRVQATITSHIEKLNGWLYGFAVQNDKRLEAMSVETVVKENKAYLQELFGLGL